MVGKSTATVETLTAEVRVLMVGSRQVTASVYGQLDEAEYEDITPFGRVTPKDVAAGYVYVVGKHAETGELIRASLPAFTAGIERWVSARSRSSEYERKAESAEYSAGQSDTKAGKCEEKVAELLGDNSWSSASHDDQSATTYEGYAAEHDGKAKAAGSETERLSAVADAAQSRLDAAKSRDKAEAKRAEAADLQAEAEGHRQAAETSRANAAEFWRKQNDWTEHENTLSGHVAAVAAEWSALPLIVLAGLR